MLTLVEESINDGDPATATFSGSLVFEKKRESLAKAAALPKFTATLRNQGQEYSNPGKPLSQAAVSSGDMSLEQMFAHHGYLTANFEYEEGETPEIKLRQNTVVLKFDLGYTGAKVSVKLPGAENYTDYTLGNNTTYMAIPDGSTVQSQMIDNGEKWDIDLASEYDNNRPATVLYEIERKTPENCVPGLFSVSADKQVFFSKGNLQYKLNPEENENPWRFAPSQYHKCFPNVYTDLTIGYPDGMEYTDHFGWGTWTKNGTQDPNSTDDNFNNYETGVGDDGGDFVNVCKEDINKALGTGWTTLSHDEWIYLLGDDYNEDATCRNNNKANALRAIKEDGEVSYLVILPDGSKANIANDSWETLESAGAVFLPAAGFRNSTDVDDVGSYGNYWSSSAFDASSAYSLYFASDGVYPDRTRNRSRGFSVRLVRAL